MNDETSYWNALKVEATFDPLTSDDAPKLYALLSVADPAQRRARFGGAFSEAAIRRHYESLDWTRYFAVGAFVRRRLEAVIEFYPDAEGRRAEIAALGLRGAAKRLGQALAASAAHHARRRGLAELIWIEPAASDPWRSTLLSLGMARAVGDQIIFSL
jgi:GNAT superfamily N-acetyltransferase